ncbi:MAG TPA: SDR family NAD(P)-dependent oxidoreductase, partial [Ktedonobacterales bacterium]|nr:SDR family NAD(P)-dependent oxidoreductase [Ktedonobacterales bacterium]
MQRCGEARVILVTQAGQTYQCAAFGSVYHPARWAARAIIGGMNANAQQQEHGTSGQSRSLAGQVAIITGASRGIGRAAALAFAAEGAAVALAARDADALA